MGTGLKQAVLWQPCEGTAVRCELCAWRCTISDGKVGHCRVRKNIGGILYSLNYHKVCAVNVDPIEKKPLFHFRPGSRSLSVATPGCNFQCDFCQNWQISQEAYESESLEGEDYPPQAIVAAAKKHGCSSISYTYTEPTIFMELAADCGRLAKQAGVENVFVTNGYMSREAVDFAAGWLDAANVDLKAFSEDYYRRFCKARLQPVLETIEYIARNTEIWLEVTTLIVPGENDSTEDMKRLAEFLVEKAGPDAPWHISRFFPQYKHGGEPTPLETMQSAARIGREAGLRYIYLGNVHEGADTICGGCGKMLIDRSGYRAGVNNLKDGRCGFCGKAIAGRW